MTNQLKTENPANVAFTGFVWSAEDEGLEPPSP